jgi:hypothetical protein
MALTHCVEVLFQEAGKLEVILQKAGNLEMIGRYTQRMEIKTDKL